MKYFKLSFPYLLIALSCIASNTAAQTPPAAPVRTITDDYHGTKVADLYRYMENFKDAEVQQWVKAQADYAASVLKKIPARNALLSHIKEIDEGSPYRVYSFRRFPDGSMFYLKLLASDDVAKLYLRDGKGNEKLLIDPSDFISPDAKHAVIDFYQPSNDGRYIAYGVAKAGSEQAILYIYDTNTGQNLRESIDRIENAYDLPQWLSDNRGFFYCRRQKLPPDAPPTEGFKNTRTFLHLLGEDPEHDRPAFAVGLSPGIKMAETDFPAIILPYGSRYAIGKIKHGDANELTLYAAPVETVGKVETPWKKICDVEDAVVEFEVLGDEIYLRTARNAPRFKVVRTSLANPDFFRAMTVVPAGEMVVDNLSVAKDALYVGLLDGGLEKILRVEHDNPSKAERLILPDGESGRVTSASPRLEKVLAKTASWVKGSVIYAFDPQTRTFTDTGIQPKGKYDDVSGYEAHEVKVKSHDGVMIPLSIFHKTGIPLNGKNPTLIWGYGSYGISINVFYNPMSLAWLERGGVMAVAHVRGGGEYGEEWRLAGQKKNKPNTWKDFIACAEYLIEKKYTSPQRLAGQGGSAGGILIGRAITERPDLFGAAIINVGCLDMLRFETTTNGVPNIPEWGSVKTLDGFKGLYEMSAFHHVKEGEKYPAVLLTHGVNDPRVEPWLSAKMAARLQAATASGKPVLFRVDYGAGHGIGSTKSQYHEELADEWSFLFWQFGLREFQP